MIIVFMCTEIICLISALRQKDINLAMLYLVGFYLSSFGVFVGAITCG